MIVRRQKRGLRLQIFICAVGMGIKHLLDVVLSHQKIGLIWFSLIQLLLQQSILTGL